MSSTAPQVERLPVGAVQPDPRNPRRHDDRQIDQIARSIQTFGFNVPILADRDGTILAGAGRWKASKKLGLSTVPVIKIEHLSETEAKAFRIADNRLTDNSVWDDRLLAETLQELSALTLDFPIEATGFDLDEIAIRIDGPDSDATVTDEKTGTPRRAMQTVSRPGDLWLLDRHRVYCGDGLDPRTYELLMQRRRAVAVYCDPPTTLRTESEFSVRGKARRRKIPTAAALEREFALSASECFQLLAQFSIEGSIHFVFAGWPPAVKILASGRAVYSDPIDIVLWVTCDSAAASSFYTGQPELVLVFRSGPSLGKAGRLALRRVWSFPTVHSSEDLAKRDKLLRLYPTAQPVEQVKDAILVCSTRGDVILDPFLGSGTTLIAAQDADRVCCGIEIDPHSVDFAIRRWQDLTGQKAVHSATGRCFDEFGNERGGDRE